MAKLVTEIVGGEPYEYVPLGEYVVRAPGVCDGRYVQASLRYNNGI